MELWNLIAVDGFAAAKMLKDRKHYRSAVSRAYFSAYAAVTAKLVNQKGVVFSQVGNNPSHKQILGLTERLPIPSSRAAGSSTRFAKTAICSR